MCADHPGPAIARRVLVYHPGMRSVVVLVVLGAAFGACEFHAAPASSGPPPPPDSATTDDAASVPPIDAAPADTAAADTAAAQVFCDPDDPHLVACYELDGDAKDRSKHQLDPHTHNVSFVAGKVGMAMQLAADSGADVDDNDALDVQALTIEAWISPSQLPEPTTLAVILDVDRQYALHLHSDGSVTCVLVNAPAQPPATTEKVTVNQWTHVACTYDAAGSAIYINGVSTLRALGGSGLSTAGTSGMSIAADNNPSSSSRSRMVGRIDQLRLLDIARTPGQICADAGKSSCP